MGIWGHFFLPVKKAETFKDKKTDITGDGICHYLFFYIYGGENESGSTKEGAYL